MEDIRINNRLIGPDHPAFIVAEIGQNHNGSMDLAKKLIDQAAHDKVDAVKLCKRHIPSELTKEKYNQPYPGVNSFGETYGKHREFLELSKEQYRELKQYAESKNLIFFSSVCDPISAAEMDEIGMPMFKIASRDLTNKPLIDFVARKMKPVFISTGMANLEEVERTIKLIRKYHNQILLFQCTSEYPSQYENINLLGLKTLKEKFNLHVGMSDHSIGIMVPCAAVAMGAVAVEKHVTLSRHMKGTDHIGALDPPGMERLVIWIRNFEKAKGNGVKSMVNAAFSAKLKLSRSIVAKRDLKKGEIIQPEHLEFKTHTKLGLDPFEDEKILGKVLTTDIAQDELILPEHLTDFIG